MHIMADLTVLEISRFAVLVVKEAAFFQTSALLVGRWFQPTPSSRLEF